MQLATTPEDVLDEELLVEVLELLLDELLVEELLLEELLDKEITLPLDVFLLLPQPARQNDMSDK